MDEITPEELGDARRQVEAVKKIVYDAFAIGYTDGFEDGQKGESMLQKRIDDFVEKMNNETS